MSRAGRPAAPSPPSDAPSAARQQPANAADAPAAVGPPSALAIHMAAESARLAVTQRDRRQERTSAWVAGMQQNQEQAQKQQQQQYQQKEPRLPEFRFVSPTLDPAETAAETESTEIVRQEEGLLVVPAREREWEMERYVMREERENPEWRIE